MPFGGQHSGSVASLEATAPRLDGNQRLFRDLQNGMVEINTAEIQSTTIQLEDEQLLDLSKFIICGLSFYHFNFRLSSWTAVSASLLPDHLRDIFDQGVFLGI